MKKNKHIKKKGKTSSNIFIESHYSVIYSSKEYFTLAHMNKETIIAGLETEILQIGNVTNIEYWYENMLTHYIDYFGEESSEVRTLQGIIEGYRRDILTNILRGETQVEVRNRFLIQFRESMKRTLNKLRNPVKEIPKTTLEPALEKLLNERDSQKPIPKKPERKAGQYSAAVFWSVVGILITLLVCAVPLMYTIGFNVGEKDNTKDNTILNQLKIIESKDNTIATYKSQREIFDKRIGESIEVLGQYKPEDAKPIITNIINELEQIKKEIR